LHMTPGTSFELTIEAGNIILSPQTESTEEDIKHSLERINKKHGAVLKRLGE